MRNEHDDSGGQNGPFHMLIRLFEYAGWVARSSIIPGISRQDL